MEQIGEWTGEGFEIGMDRQLSSIAKKAKEIGETVSETLEKTKLNGLKISTSGGLALAGVGNTENITNNNHFSITIHGNIQSKQDIERLAREISIQITRQQQRQSRF